MKDNMTKIREALAAAYRENEPVSADELWDTRVMGHVRSLVVPVSASSASFSVFFGRFVWRFAPVACILIVALTIGLANLDYTPEYEITASFMTDPIASAVEQVWGT